jgi:2'-5' RNA ligase superfamily
MPERESAIGINVPQLAELVDRWRLSTVAVASLGVPPHITLLYPWRPAPLLPADVTQVAAAVGGTAPFTFVFRRVERFPGALYLPPEPDDAVRTVLRRLVEAFPETPPYGGQFGSDPIPHLTVAKAATEQELDRLQAEVLTVLEPIFPLSVYVHALSIEEEGPDGNWHLVSMIELT